MKELEKKLYGRTPGDNLTVCLSKYSKRLILWITWVWRVTRACKENMSIETSIVL